MSFLGLDLGGSGAKAAIYSSDGTALASNKVPYGWESPGQGWLEFNPRTQWEALRQVIRCVAAYAATVGDPIEGIGLSVAGEAVVPVDQQRRPIYNAIASTDPRGREYLPMLRQTFGDDGLRAVSGQPLDYIYALPRVLWFKEHLPDVYRRTWKFLLWQEIVLLRLGIEPHVDYSNAVRTLAFDLNRKEWARAVFEAVGVRQDLFAPAVSSNTVVGQISQPVAEDLGLPTGCPVVCGAMDQSCAALGVGVLHGGTTAIGTGSVEAVSLAVTDDVITSGRLSQLPISPYCGDKWLLSAISTFSAGSAIEWARSLLQLPSYAEFTIPVPSRTGPSPLLVVPHFAGAFSGQRDDTATAAIYGLTLKTEPVDVARALIEGLTFELRLTLETLEAASLAVGELRNGGGGSQSDSWLSLKAIVLNRPISRPIVRDSSCLGAAIHAAVGVTAFRGYDEAIDGMVHMARTFEPDPGALEAYEERYRAYLTARRQTGIVSAELEGDASA